MLTPTEHYLLAKSRDNICFLLERRSKAALTHCSREHELIFEIHLRGLSSFALGKYSPITARKSSTLYLISDMDTSVFVSANIEKKNRNSILKYTMEEVESIQLYFHDASIARLTSKKLKAGVYVEPTDTETCSNIDSDMA